MGSHQTLQNTVAEQTPDCGRRLAGDLPGTGSKACARGVPDAIKGRCAAHRSRPNRQELQRPVGRSSSAQRRELSASWPV